MILFRTICAVAAISLAGCSSSRSMDVVDSGEVSVADVADAVAVNDMIAGEDVSIADLAERHEQEFENSECIKAEYFYPYCVVSLLDVSRVPPEVTDQAGLTLVNGYCKEFAPGANDLKINFKDDRLVALFAEERCGEMSVRVTDMRVCSNYTITEAQGACCAYGDNVQLRRYAQFIRVPRSLGWSQYGVSIDWTEIAYSNPLPGVCHIWY